MTAALEGGKWSAARPGRTLTPVKTCYPLYRRLGGPQGRSGQAENHVITGIQIAVHERKKRNTQNNIKHIIYKIENKHTKQENKRKKNIKNISRIITK
jgi:hypothetical protein